MNKYKFNNTIKLLLEIVFISLFMSSSLNIIRITYVDKISSIEVFHYPKTATINIENKGEKYSEEIYYINNYFYHLYIYRIDHNKAIEKVKNSNSYIILDGHKYYITDDGEIVIKLPLHYVKKRSIIDHIMIKLFYNDINEIYYVTDANSEHYKTIKNWYENEIFE